MFRLFLGGGEVPGWRKMLAELQVPNVGVSFYGMEKRLPKSKPWLVGEHFHAGQAVLLESGAYTLNQRAEVTPGDLETYAERYYDFVEDNLHRLDGVVEFDSTMLGRAWIEGERANFWDTRVPRDKVMVVWHKEDGIGVLEALCERYQRVVVPDLPDQPQRLNLLARKHGTRLHAAGIVDMAVLRKYEWDSASTTSWVSPMRFGETIVWDRNRLTRYPMPMKAKARHRHRSLFAKAGFDPDLIAKDDTAELARFTVWSFLRLEEAVAKAHSPRHLALVRDGEGAAQTKEGTPMPNAEDGGEAAAQTSAEPPNRLPALRRERQVLPSMLLGTLTVHDGDAERLVPAVRSAKRSLRRCDNCIVSSTCPAYAEGMECAYDIPIEVETKAQLLTMLTGILEMQTARVLFAKMAEDLEGGYPDGNLSAEMDRLFRQAKMLKDIEETAESLSINIKGSGGGLLSTIFGRTPPVVPVMDRGRTEAFLGDVVEGEVIE